MSVTKRLPDRPNLRHLKEQAFQLRESFSRGDMAARERVYAHSALERFNSGGAWELTVTQSQFVIAREYGFRSWPELKRAVEEKLRAQETRRGPMTEEMRNIEINEAGTIEAGAYGSISINGTGTADGDVEARSVVVNGAGNFGGSLKAGQMTVNGACRVGDMLDAGTLMIEGDLNVGDGLAAKEVSISGGCRVGDDLKTGALKVNGGLSVGDGVACEVLSVNGGVKAGDAVEARSAEITGGLKAESLRVVEKLSVKRGGISVGEDVTAGEIEMELDSDSRAEVIKARRVRVRAVQGRFEDVGRQVTENVKIALGSAFAGRMAGMFKGFFKGTEMAARQSRVSEAVGLREAARSMAREAERLAARADELEGKASREMEEEEARLEKVIEDAERKIEEARRKVEELRSRSSGSSEGGAQS